MKKEQQSTTRSPTPTAKNGLSINYIKFDGIWDFAYTYAYDGSTKTGIPDADCFETKMQVPGYWDDYIETLKTAKFWSYARFNSDFRRIDFPIGIGELPDASLPYLLGVGWYRKKIQIPVEWETKRIVLSIGGVVLEAWVWVNGRMAAHHVGHSTPFDVRIDEYVETGMQEDRRLWSF